MLFNISIKLEQTEPTLMQFFVLRQFLLCRIHLIVTLSSDTQLYTRTIDKRGSSVTQNRFIYL